MPNVDDGPIVEYFATNLRKAREQRGLSQADLAQRVKELGQPCTQATIWKLEQGHREPRLAEAVAIGQALDLWSWSELTKKPDGFNVALTVDRWRQRVYELAEQTRAAAAAQIEAQVNLAFAVHQAVNAGLSVKWAEARSGGWLEMTPEATVLREVLAARVALESQDGELEHRETERERLEARIVSALESSGVPLAIHPDDIRDMPAEPAAPEDEPEPPNQGEKPQVGDHP